MKWYSSWHLGSIVLVLVLLFRGRELLALAEYPYLRILELIVLRMPLAEYVIHM